MLQFKVFGITIKFNFMFFAVIEIVLFTAGSEIAILAFCAALMHELGHVICFILCGQKPEFIAFECSGIKMKENVSHNTSNFQELLILSSGCAVNFIICVLSYKSGLLNLSIVHLIIGIFNLLPVLSLDGGKIILLLLSNFLDYELAYRIIKTASYIFCVGLIAIGAFFVYYLNFSLFITGIYLFISLLVEK